MKYKRNFIDGTVNIEDINDVQALLLNKINIANTPRAFQVKAVPSNDVVYWSYSRKKANNYIRNIVAKRDLMILFGETIEEKSLDYNYRYSPNEYLLSFALCAVLFVFLASSHLDDNFFTYFIFFSATFCLVRNVISRKAYNKLKVDEKI